MRNYRHILVAFLLSLPLFWSCEKSLSGEEGETVDIVLQIGMKSSDGASTKADENVLPYEGIRTLRVLVISDAEQPTDRKILYNEKQVIDSSDDPTSAKLSASLTLKDIPVGKASIYLIANEESIGIEYTDSVLMDPKYKYDNKLLLLDEGWKHFPKTYDEIAEYGLPMSGRVEGVDISSSSTKISVELERAVVKLHLTVENATSDVLVLNWVKFGKFISDRVYLFRQSELDIPSDTEYKELRYPEDESNTLNVTLAVKAQTEWNPVYIYPNFAYKDPTGSNPYTLSLATDNKVYSPSLISSNMNSMVRNTQFNILARITASATIDISYSYVRWTDVNVDVPPFN